MGYLDWLPSSGAKAPPWLTRGWGGVWLKATGLFLDAMSESAKQAVKLRFPSHAMPDALAAIGEERQSPRATAYTYEVDSLYAARLVRTWADRVYLGTRTGLEAIVAVFGFTNVQVFEVPQWNPGSPWNWSWILVQQPHPWTSDGNWGDPGLWGNGGTWGSSAELSQIANIRGVLSPWVPAHVRCWFVLALGDGVWGDGGLWGDGGVWGGAAVSWPIHRED